MKMNVKLLRRVQKHMVNEPRRINMNVVAASVAIEDVPCGTVGCIAGWACLLSGASAYAANLDFAQKVLGLDRTQRDRLFAEPHLALSGASSSYEAIWPKKFARRYEQARTPKGRANALHDRIDHFIATKGKD